MSVRTLRTVGFASKVALCAKTATRRGGLSDRTRSPQTTLTVIMMTHFNTLIQLAEVDTFIAFLNADGGYFDMDQDATESSH